MKARSLISGKVEDVESPFYTAYHRPLKDDREAQEEQHPTHIIEPYVKPEVRIASMMEAGKRLREFRKLTADQVEAELVAEDPTRRPGYDLVDAYKAVQAKREKILEIRKKAQEAALLRAQEEEKAKFDAAVELQVKERLAKTV